MTVSRSHDPEHLAATNPPAAGPAEAADAIALVEDIDAGAGTSRVRTGSRDAISLSARAQMLLRAGLAVRALVYDAMTSVYRTLRLGTRTIVLEFGVYR